MPPLQLQRYLVEVLRNQVFLEALPCQILHHVVSKLGNLTNIIMNKASFLMSEETLGFKFNGTLL